MRNQLTKSQQAAISAVRLDATRPIIHSNIGAKMGDLFTRGKTNLRLMAGGLVLAALSGCGGGGVNGGTDSSSVAISGRVADGYINGATVFWDCNGDKTPNASEIQVKSGVGGGFSISEAPSVSCILAAYVPVGAKDEDASNQTVSRSYTMLSTKGSEKFISPISTLVATHLNENPGVTLLDASQAVANLLGIRGNIHSDYIAETGPDAIRRHGVSIVIANVLQKNNTLGATAASLSDGYAEIKSRAPAIASANLTTPSSIDSFLNPFRGFLKQSTPTVFSKLAADKYAVRPNSKLPLTPSQLTALDALINLPAVAMATRLGVINWSELTDAEFTEALNLLKGAGLIADLTPRLQAIRDARQVLLTATNGYFDKNLAQTNKFFASNIAANFQFITSTSISGIEAIGGAISAGTGIDVPNLYRYRGTPIAKGIIRTTTQPEIRDVVLALLNATSLSLECTKNINAALQKGDDEEISKAEFDCLIELVDQLITIQKDILKNGDFGLAGKLFGPALKFYGVTQECNSASSECFAASLEILETVAEWIPGTPTRVKGLLKWIRSTFDAYSQGKEYAAVTDSEVIFARDEVLKDWDSRIAQIMLTSKKAEFSVGGYERYFEGYDPSIPCGASAKRIFGVCVPPVPVSGSFSVFNFTGTSADSSISRIGKLPVAFAPNDAGIGFGMENYTQNNTTKLGIFRISRSNGIFSLLAGAAGAVINESISVVAVNDSGQAIISKMIVDVNAPTVATYSLVGTGGALTPLDIQSTGPVVLLNNGNIAVLANDSHGVKFYDQSSKFLNDINVGTTYYIQGLGKDGLIYGLRSSPSAPPMPGTLNPPVNFGEFIPIVIFNDGLTKDLPCNLTSRSMYMPGSSLTRPASGIECSNILAASGNGYVAGHFHHSDGRQGVFRYSKLGFEEITINPSYFGKSMFGTGTTLEPPTVRGISNDGTILLAPAYSNSQTCQGGPYFVSGTTITDLKSYIPTNSCFNISAGISGGSRVFMSSQAQGVSLYMVRNP